uniref:Ribonuclease A-domain domain-containing protein n=1 Tax=Sinocyclocheilus grahami TaxID=75366 RepID=A0A672KFD1_SINGR
MRSVALLSLLFILALSDGADRQKNDRYAEFKKKHILPTDFQTDNKIAWVEHLVNNDLCGRTSVQSFIKDSEENIKLICNGSGTKTRDNYIKSTNLFQVYNITSEKSTSQMLEWECKVNCSTAKYHVIVECQNNLPVHYHYSIFLRILCIKKLLLKALV